MVFLFGYDFLGSFGYDVSNQSPKAKTRCWCALNGIDVSRFQMAEGGEDPLTTSLQKLDDELTCPVCTQHFREPKVLPCLHFYCKTCIADLIKSAKGRPFNCPECRREAQATKDDPER